MTVKELRRLLEEYADDIQVLILRERLPYGSGSGELTDIEVRMIIDQDTNEASLCFNPKTLS